MDLVNRKLGGWKVRVREMKVLASQSSGRDVGCQLGSVLPYSVEEYLHGLMGAPVLGTRAYLRALRVLYPCPSVLQTAETGPVQGQPRG